MSKYAQLDGQSFRNKFRLTTVIFWATLENQLQAQHLRKLAERPEDLIIPLDLYETSKIAKPLLDSLPGRRLTEAECRGNVQVAVGGRMFQGPEPSWIRKKRQQAS